MACENNTFVNNTCVTVNTTCENTTCENGTLAGPSEAADITIGTILLMCTALGVPANAVSFLYFYIRKANNSNEIVFKWVYTIIAAVDCLICALQFPFIHTLFNNRTKDGSVFLIIYKFCKQHPSHQI